MSAVMGFARVDVIDIARWTAIIAAARLVITRTSSKVFTRLFHITNPKHVPRVGESFFYHVYFLSVFVFGMVIVWDKPWFWSFRHMADGFLTESWLAERQLARIELGFYLSSMCFHFFDIRKGHSDFIMMFVHHLTSSFLICFAYGWGYMTWTVMALVTHDAADIFLELAKVLHYCKFDRVRKFSFWIMIPVWAGPRLGMFPAWVPFTLLEMARNWAKRGLVIPNVYVHWSLIWGLLVLGVLDAAWTYMIVHLAVIHLRKGYSQDPRSDDERETSEAKKAHE